MSTRAMYSFSDDLGTHHVYVHYDGYPTGAADKIAAALKAVMPKGWKYSLGVDNHSTIVLTIASAPVDLIAEAQKVVKSRLLDWQIAQGYADKTKPTEMSVNHYHLDGAFTGALLATFKKIVAALNLDNHDRSDLQSDHFDVGHYVEINVGAWNKAFVVRA